SPFYVIAPGARWKTKQWLPDRFAEVASRLEGFSLIIGSNSDRFIGEKICEISKEGSINLAGDTSIEDLILLIRHAKAVISNDTGPMHIAAALNKPVVAIFGPTNPTRTGPYGKNCRVLIPKIDCAPCYKKKCVKMNCMNHITTNQVLDALKDLLDNNNPERF
ncbi:MAG: glycosyltransferase family 9 protein, partial [Thermodesulfovibrionales bacterium]